MILMGLTTKCFFRGADEPLYTYEALHKYCLQESQDVERTKEVLEGLHRYEVYVYDQDGNVIACTYLVRYLCMHHGDVIALAALWIDKSYRDAVSVQKAITREVVTVCKMFGITKYQRSKHLSKTKQLIITKEIPNGIR